MDYTGAGKAEVAVFRPTTAEWFVGGSAPGPVILYQQFGAGNLDQPVPADYDGVGRAEFAVYRRSTSQWFINQSAVAAPNNGYFGAPGDVPVPALYDSTGHADIAVYRPRTSEWFVMGPTGGVAGYEQFGQGGLDYPLETPLVYRYPGRVNGRPPGGSADMVEVPPVLGVVPSASGGSAAVLSKAAPQVRLKRVWPRGPYVVRGNVTDVGPKTGTFTCWRGELVSAEMRPIKAAAEAAVSPRRRSGC
jgi:hypothetical protein